MNVLLAGESFVNELEQIKLNFDFHLIIEHSPQPAFTCSIKVNSMVVSLYSIQMTYTMCFGFISLSIDWPFSVIFIDWLFIYHF